MKTYIRHSWDLSNQGNNDKCCWSSILDGRSSYIQRGKMTKNTGIETRDQLGYLHTVALAKHSIPPTPRFQRTLMVVESAQINDCIAYRI